MCSEGSAALGAELGLLVKRRAALGALDGRLRCRCLRSRCSWCRCGVLRRRNTLGVHHGAAASVAKAVGTKVLAVARLAVHLAVVVAQRRRVQKLAARLALETHLVPLAPRALRTLCKVHWLATPRTLAHCFLKQKKKDGKESFRQEREKKERKNKHESKRVKE